MIWFLFEKSVPPCDIYAGHDFFDSASRNQVRYFKYFEKKLNKNNYPDIDGQVSYLYMYLFTQLNARAVNFSSLHYKFLTISQKYSQYSDFSRLAYQFSADCLIPLNRLNDYLVLTKPKSIKGTSTHMTNFRLNLQYDLGFEPDYQDIIKLSEYKFSKFTLDNLSQFESSLIKHISNLNKGNEIFEFFDSEVKKTKNNFYNHTLFWGIHNNLDNHYPNIRAFYSSQNILHYLNQIIRAAENDAREELNLPKIGEGWISETSLFNLIKSSFQGVEVIHHGKPKWLGRQHFDIWMPDNNIAIEYHGKQHFEPVEFFGGEKAYIETVRRDKKKANLAKKNDVTLFVVTEGFDENELREKITKNISNREIFDSNSGKDAQNQVAGEC